MAAIEHAVGTSLRLPCGLVLKNRFVKSAMSEKMATDGLPNSSHRRIYQVWAQGGWAALVTGTSPPPQPANVSWTIAKTSPNTNIDRKHHGG